MINLLDVMEGDMDSIIKSLKLNLSKLRSSNVNIHLFDNVRVDYYDEKLFLDQVTVLTYINARTFSIKPWDKSLIKLIEKSILSELGINSTTQGDVIFVKIPELTEEKRKELTKQVFQYAEESKVLIRNVRRNFNENVKKIEKSEDEEKRMIKLIQEKTDKKIEEINQIAKVKEKDILTL